MPWRRLSLTMRRTTRTCRFGSTKIRGDDHADQHAHRDLDLRVRHGGQMDQVLDRPVAQGLPDALGLLVDLCVGGVERQIDVAGAEQREADLHRAGALPAGQVEGDGELDDGGSSRTTVLARSMSSVEEPLGLVEAAGDVRGVRALEGQVVGQLVLRLPASPARAGRGPRRRGAAADWKAAAALAFLPARRFSAASSSRSAWERMSAAPRLRWPTTSKSASSRSSARCALQEQPADAAGAPRRAVPPG